MNIREVKEALGKAKIYAMKGDCITSLPLMLKSLREICISSSASSIDIRGLIREVTQLYDRDPSIKGVLGSRLAYTPGHEKTLYVSLKKAYELLTNGKLNESHAVALERKGQLDKYIMLGKKYLSAGDVSNADQAFHEAIKFYRDEHIVFSYIGKILLDADQILRASFYLKKAISLDPENKTLRAMVQGALAKES